MKNLLNIVISLSVVAFLYSEPAAAGNQPNNGISMTIYPVVRGDDGNQYLITPSGKHVTVPGLGIAQNATQIPVYRDTANHWWYTNFNGQQVAVSPQQLEAAQAQINAQSGGGGAQSYYSATPSYAGGYNGIPYGTPVNMDGQGQYSYMGSGGSKQVITPTPQSNAQFSQWQQQTPYGQPQNAGNMQYAQTQQSSTSRRHGTTLGDNRRDRRANRLDNRSQNQASNAANDQDYANSKMDSGHTLGTGFRSRKSARETRRSNREDRRADRLTGN